MKHLVVVAAFAVSLFVAPAAVSAQVNTFEGEALQLRLEVFGLMNHNISFYARRGILMQNSLAGCG